MAKQVNQKAISAKVDGDIFEQMEAFCNRNNIKRNRFINQAVDEYLKNHWNE